MVRLIRSAIVKGINGTLIYIFFFLSSVFTFFYVVVFYMFIFFYVYFLHVNTIIMYM